MVVALDMVAEVVMLVAQAMEIQVVDMAEEVEAMMVIVKEEALVEVRSLNCIRIINIYKYKSKYTSSVVKSHLKIFGRIQGHVSMLNIIYVRLVA